ncbi:MAG: hypothetical protein IJK71_08525 [Clostridia bacterium]|nr:hypothetical protein [Clostridia bacterium]
MYKRLIGLVLALVLMVGSVPVSAGGSLTVQEIVEQVIVPLALANDTDPYAVYDVYTHEQLAEIMRVLAENGITYKENDAIMQYLQNGLGYYESYLLHDVCSRAFDGRYGIWTQEQKDWYAEQEYAISHVISILPDVPGEDNMSLEEAEAFAMKKIRELYETDQPLEDRNIWDLSVRFEKGRERDEWTVSLYPKDIEHGYYVIRFDDSNPDESAAKGFSSYMNLPNPEKPYTAFRLEMAFTGLYGWEKTWPQEYWTKYHELMLGAEMEPGLSMNMDYEGYRMTNYPAIEASDISREDAIRIAKEALGKERAAFDSAVLTEYEGERTWLVTLVIHAPVKSVRSIRDPEKIESYTVSLDSTTGEVRSLRQYDLHDDSKAMAYIAEGAYNKTREGLMKMEDLLPEAVKIIREQYPRLGDPLDEKEYSISRSKTDNSIYFETRNPHHGGFTFRLNQDGTSSVVTEVPASYNGDNLFDLYKNAYGYGIWDQSIWVLLEQDMKELNPEKIEGKILKATRYPEESSVSIQHAQAQELGKQATGYKGAFVNSCVLVDAQPHPVWIMRYTMPGPTKIIGIDAETGETVFSLKHTTDFTPTYESYTLPETWRRLELEMEGSAYVAMKAIIERYVPENVYWKNSYDLIHDWENWDLEVDGLTVRYIGRWKGMKSYEVELDENGNVLRCEETDSSATEEKPAE